MSRPTVEFIDRLGCHLCAQAWPVVSDVAAARGIEVRRIDVDSDENLQALYSVEIPVVLINGEQHSFHGIDPERFARALDKAMRQA